MHGRLSLEWRDAENPANILKTEIYCNIFNYIVASFFRSVILSYLTIALKIRRHSLSAEQAATLQKQDDAQDTKGNVFAHRLI